MSVGEPDYCWQTLHAPFSTGWLPIICMSTENQESSFELICFWRGKYEYFLWVLLINIFGEACFGNVVKEDYPKMEILINGVIANVVERRRCQWVLTNQDRSEVLRKHVLCVYACVCTVFMCICGCVFVYIVPSFVHEKCEEEWTILVWTPYDNIERAYESKENAIIFYFPNLPPLFRGWKKSGQYWQSNVS